jgi:hypothetical protein
MKRIKKTKDVEYVDDDDEEQEEEVLVVIENVKLSMKCSHLSLYHIGALFA